jgi:hypothetical protein
VRALSLGVVAVLFGIALVFGLSVMASRGDVELSNLGDREFDAGNARTKAEKVAEEGPILFPDASGGTARDIYLQHLGGTWYAIAAGDRDCTLEWSQEEERFTEPCTGDTFPADGEGRTRYRTRVKDNRLFVDFTTILP